MSHSQITNANNYSLRDTLLLSQLLYINNIKDQQDLEKIESSLLQDILQKWKTHISTQLEHKTIKVNTLNQLKDLYKNFLKKYQVDNTESLANEVYYKRINELEEIITEKKKAFRAVLTENQN